MVKPVFRLERNGEDVTAKISQCLVSIQATDEAGIQSDTLSIIVADELAQRDLPNEGEELTLSLGYEFQQNEKPVQDLVEIGTYVIDAAGIRSGVDQIRIRATAADLHGSLKEHKQRAWENVKIGEIITTIAQDHGLDPVVGEDLAEIKVEREDQIDENDMQFLTRLALAYNAIAKPVAKKLLFVKRGQGRTASGQDLEPVVLSPGQWTEIDSDVEQRNRFKSVVAYYHDNDLGERVQVQVGSGVPQFTIKGNQTNYATALSMAQAKFDDLKRGSVEIDVSLPGRPDIFAETPVTLTGFRPTVDGDFTASSVRHSYTSSGFKTTFSADNKA